MAPSDSAVLYCFSVRIWYHSTVQYYIVFLLDFGTIPTVQYFIVFLLEFGTIPTVQYDIVFLLDFRYIPAVQHYIVFLLDFVTKQYNTALSE
jgi:hypothetical protein